MVESIFFGGTYHQYNVGCSFSSEACARRIQAIVDANSDPGQIDLSQAKHFRCVGSLDEAIGPEMKAHVARCAKGEAVKPFGLKPCWNMCWLNVVVA